MLAPGPAAGHTIKLTIASTAMIHNQFQPPVQASSLNRRGFLAKTLAAAAVTPWIDAPALRAAQPAPAARKIKLGVVGCGGRGCWIAGLFKRHGGYDMWAVADYFQSVADSCGQGLGVDPSRRFSGLGGFRKLIESGVEAVALETPPYFFPEHVKAAVAAGLHVYMAKPVAVDVWGCLEVEAAAKRATAARKVFLVDYQLPTEPDNIEVVKMIRAGEIGPLATLNSHYFSGLFPDPAFTQNLESRFRSLVWCNDIALGGGYHVNACIHAVDPALWIAGKRPVSCMGASRTARPTPHGDSHDVFQLLFEFDNGLVLNHRGKHLNNLTGFDVVCQAQGQTGHAQVCYGGKTFLKGPENGYNKEIANPYEPGAVRNIATFHRAVLEERTQNETVPRAIDGALAAILGREAARRGVKLTLAELLKENQRLAVDLSGLKT